MPPTHHSQLLERAKLIFAPHLPFQPIIFPAVPLMLFPFVSIFCVSFLFSLYICREFWRSLLSFFPQSEQRSVLSHEGWGLPIDSFVRYVCRLLVLFFTVGYRAETKFFLWAFFSRKFPQKFLLRFLQKFVGENWRNDKNFRDSFRIKKGKINYFYEWETCFLSDSTPQLQLKTKAGKGKLWQPFNSKQLNQSRVRRLFCFEAKRCKTKAKFGIILLVAKPQINLRTKRY